MQKITPYLWFDYQLEEAVHFYTSIFKDGKISEINQMPDEVPGQKGRVITAAFELAGLEFLGLNGGPSYSFTPSTSFFVYCQDEVEIDALWQNLSEGGVTLMELDRYPFSEKYGWVQDKFGLSWQLSMAGVPQTITPYLMFSGEQHSRAEEAIRFYTSLFKNSSITHIERYGKGQDEPERSVMHASFLLDGQKFLAMDSSLDHGFTFTNAVSFFVTCEDQAEVNYFWDRLAEGGEIEMCGWLKDRFSVSWQIIPRALGELMNDPDPERAGRVMRAMLEMKKIDVSLLQQAYERVS